jgi:hypothetical protein
LILPLLSRLAAVDFFGTDDFRERVEVLLGFDDVLRDRVDEREEWRTHLISSNPQPGAVRHSPRELTRR